MTKVSVSLFCLLFLASLTFGQKQKDAKIIPLQAANWKFLPGMVEFMEYKSRPSMKILPKAGNVVLKDTDFGDGTIEMDFEPVNPYFALLYFRYQDSLENESFYFRTQAAGHPQMMDGVQYAPTVKGVLFWNLLPHFQTNANFQMQTWNHIKLVLSGKQMRVYVNSASKPTLLVPRMEGNTTHGTLAFAGEGIISNLVIKPGLVEGLLPEEGIDPSDNDPRYIRHWQVSPSFPVPQGIDFSDSLKPGKETVWQPIDAERRAAVNLSRIYGKGKSRRIAWLKVNIHTDSAQSRKINLGFLDEVWVFLNGRYLYVDKNYYAQPIMKEPEGRLSIENTSFQIPLKKGDNELLIGVGSNFYSWAIVARLDNIEGITFQ
ncbi:hypothetical protein ACX0G9_16495 [Flavitalea flava]